MFRYPYGDSQQLNLDWILAKLKELEQQSGSGGGADLEEVANALISASYAMQNYNRSDIVFYNGKLYRANQNITAESWNPAHWDEILLGDTVANIVRYVGSLNNSQVANSSTVAGTHTSDALNNLASDISDVNDAISVLENGGITYHVGANQQYTSFTGLCLSLANDTKEKTIIVHDGDYDIFAEYTALGLLSGNPPDNPTMDYFDYNVLIPENTTVIGLGRVVLKWAPTDQQISEAWSKTISTINTAGNVQLENLTIYCKNGRYCLHDDQLGDSTYDGKRKIFKNITFRKFLHDGNLGFRETIGLGLSKDSYYEFDGCEFYNQDAGNNFYAHNTAKSNNVTIPLNGSPFIQVKHCYIHGSTTAVRFGNVTGSSAQQIRVNFNSCYIAGNVLVADEASPSTGNNANTFLVSLQNCNSPKTTIVGTNPNYSPIAEYVGNVNIIPTKQFVDPSVVTARTYNIPSNGRFLMTIATGSVANCGLYMVWAFAAGTVGWIEIRTASNLTLSSSTPNQLTITSGDGNRSLETTWWNITPNNTIKDLALL